MKKSVNKRYFTGKFVNIIICLIMILVLFPFSIFAEDEGDNIPTLITSGSAASVALEPEGNGTIITTTNNVNPLSKDDNWFQVSAGSGFYLDSRNESSSLSFSSIDYTKELKSTGTDATSTDDNVKAVQSTAFRATANTSRNYVATIGFYKEDGAYKTKVAIHKPQGDELSGITWITLGDSYTCNYMDTSKKPGETFPLPTGGTYMTGDIVAGDFDGDGVDSLIVYFAYDEKNYGLYELKYNPETDQISASDITTTGLHPNYSACYDFLMTEHYMDDGRYQGCGLYRLCAQLSVGDLNGDGIDDLATISMCEGMNDFNSSPTRFNLLFPYLGIFYGATSQDILTSGFCATDSFIIQQEKNTRKWTKQTSSSSWVTYYDNTYEGFRNPALALGDYDNDGVDEIAIGGIECIIKDFDESTVAQSAQYPTQMEHFTGFSDRAALLALYEFKSGVESERKMVQLSWNLVKASSSAFNGGEWVSRGMSTATAVRWNGMGNAELLFLDGALYDMSNGTPTKALDVVGLSQNTYDTVGYYQVQTGNFSGNSKGAEDLLIYYYQSTGSSAYDVTGYNEKTLIAYNSNTTGDITQYSSKQINIRSKSETYSDTKKAYKIGYGSQTSIASYEPASRLLMLRFTGEVRCLYSNPKVIAVLEAAPYFGELSVNAGSTNYSYTTRYSYGHTESTQDSVSVSSSTNFYAGTCFAGIDQLTTYVQTTMKSNGFSDTLTTIAKNSFTAANENSVVILRIPNYEYTYEVMGNNENIVISVPQKPSYAQLTVAAYNEYALAYNRENVYTQSEREQIFDDSVSRYNSEHPDAPIDTSSEYCKTARKNFVNMKVDELKTISIGKDGDLPADNVGNPWAYTIDNFSFGTESWFSSSTAELGYGGGNISIGAGQIEEKKWTQEESHSNSVSSSVTLTVKSGSFLNPFDLFMRCSSGDTTGKTYSQGKFTSQANETDISGTVTNLNVAQMAQELGTSEQVLKKYYFNWQLGYWMFKYTEGENGQVPVVGYRLDSKISVPLGKPGSLSILNKTVDNDTTDFTLNWTHNPVHGNASYFYITAQDYYGNNLKISTPDAEVTEYFGVPCVRVNANDSGSYSISLHLNCLLDDSSRVDIAKIAVFAADSTNVPPALDGLSVPSSTSLLTIQSKDGKSAYEVAVDNGFTGTEEEWLASLKGEQGNQGEQGDQGEQGVQGVQGPTGSQGTQGVQGIQGEKGEQGVPGLSAYELALQEGYSGTLDEWFDDLKGEEGASITSVYLDDDANMIVTLSDGNTINAGSLKDETLHERVDRLEMIATVALGCALAGLAFNVITLIVALKKRAVA